MAPALTLKDTSALLFLGTNSVEWVPKPNKEGSGYIQGACEGQSAQEQANAARILVEAAGEKPGKCTLLLGGAIVRQRIVALPSVGEKQMKAVLHRKAAHILDVELHQTAFTATEVETGEGAKERRWLISAVRLDELRALTRHLRANGFQVRRVVYSRLGLLSAGMDVLSRAGGTGAGIVVGVESDSVAISLVSGDCLVQQTVVPGKFDVNSTMGTSVLQELRGVESHWRRQSRGGSVTQVVVAGLAQAEVEHFELACHAALPSSEFLLAGGEPELDRDMARAAYLKTCATGSSPSADFTRPIPPRRSALWVMATAALVGGVYLGGPVQERLEGTRASISARTEVLRGDVHDSDTIDRDLEQNNALQAEIRARKAQLEAIDSMGLDAHDWMELTFRSFENRAILDSLHMDDYGSSSSLRWSGRVPADPVLSVKALTELKEIGGQDPRIHALHVELPTSLGGSTSNDSTLNFQVTASIRSEREIGGHAR